MNLLTIPSGLVWPDMPAALTEIFGGKYRRTKHNLSQFAPIYHPFVSAQAEGSNALLVRASNWNAVHLAKSGSAQVRLVAWVVGAGAAGSVLRAQYSLDGSSWSYLDGATGPEVSIASASTDTPAVSSWVVVTAAALADVYLRLVGLTGDGAVDPEFGEISLQYK